MGSTVSQLLFFQNEVLEERLSPKVIKTSKLITKKCISLSDREYNVFQMTLKKEKIGYFGVQRNGVDIIHFIEDYIRTKLALTPISIYQ